MPADQYLKLSEEPSSDDDSPTLRADPSASLVGHRPSNTAWVKEQYVARLTQHRLLSAGFLPNWEPLLRWRNTSEPCTPLSMFSSPNTRFLGMTNMLSGRLLPDIPDEEEEKSPKKSGFFGEGSIKGSVVNIAAATLGAGALSLPRAFYYAGLFYAVVFMIVLVTLAVMSIQTIIKTIHLAGKNTFEECAKKAFGPWFTLFYEVNIILFCFGTAVGYMMTVGDISTQAFERILGGLGDGLFLTLVRTPNVVLTAITVCLLLPLSLCDKVNELRYASLMAVTCILVLVGVVCYMFIRKGLATSLPDYSAAFEPKGGITGIFKMLSLAIFAFCCQPNVPSIYCELERRSFQRMNKVGLRGMVLSFVVYFVMGVCGFLAFGEKTEGNVMMNLQPTLCENDPIVILGFVCMAFAVTMSFPLNIFPIRFSIETILFYHKPHLNTRSMKFLITVVTVGMSLLAAISVPSINLIFELVGATTGSFVCFIGPGLLYCKIDRSPPRRLFQRSKWTALCLVAVGTLFLILGTYSSVVDIIEQMNSPPTTPQHC